MLLQTAAPTAEPISVAEARSHCAVIGVKHDALLAGFISAAREAVENYTERALCDASYRFRVSTFNSPLILPRPLIDSITTLTYLDGAGTRLTIDGADYGFDEMLGLVAPLPGLQWPTGTDVLVTYKTKAGFVPAALISAMKLILADLFANREANAVNVSISINPTLERLMRPHRLRMGV